MSDPQHEPTMEEILASIRKIISEDGPETPATPAASAPAPEEPDILELTQEVAPAPQPYQPPAPQPEPVHQDDVMFVSQPAATDSGGNGPGFIACRRRNTSASRSGR